MWGNMDPKKIFSKGREYGRITANLVRDLKFIEGHLEGAKVDLWLKLQLEKMLETAGSDISVLESFSEEYLDSVSKDLIGFFKKDYQDYKERFDAIPLPSE
jgi:hypothetical protein